MSSSSHSPCAACKFLRRKCTQECVFAPYFPPDQPQKFASVHRVYGASNVAKILNEMPVSHREEAVASLAYEAEARLRDPIYGCVGFISYLSARLKQIQAETLAAKKELATFLGSSAVQPNAMMMMYPSTPYTAAAATPVTPQQYALFQQQQQMFGNGSGFDGQQQAFPAAIAFDGGAGAGVVAGLGSGHVVDSDGYQVVQVHQPHNNGGGLHDYHHHLLINNVPHQDTTTDHNHER